MNRPEGQPQLKFIKPFKRVVDNLVQRGNKEQSPSRLLTNISFAQREKEFLKTYNPLTDPLMIQERERRAKDPKLPTHMELNGQMLTPLEHFRAVILLYDRLEQEALERGDTKIDHSQLPWSTEKYEELTPELRRFQNSVIIGEARYLMAKEAQKAQFDGIAESIQENIWKRPLSPNSPILIKPAHKLKMGIKDDGSTSNRSRFGASISYARTDILSNERGNIPQTPREELFFGIGYFGDKSVLIPEAQASVQDEELEDGVKSYFVQRSYMVNENGRMVRKTDVYAIPLAYPESQKTFFTHLYKSAKFLTPDIMNPQENQEAKTYRRSRQKAG